MQHDEIAFTYVEDCDFGPFWSINHARSDTAGTCGRSSDGAPGYYCDVTLANRQYVTARKLATLEDAMMFAVNTIHEAFPA